MPNDQGYHGSENASTDELFKPKSHYVASSGTRNQMMVTKIT